MNCSVNITKRSRKRKLTSGAVVEQTRWVLNYREPRSGQRRQLFFEKQKDAQAKRNQIVAHRMRAKIECWHQRTTSSHLAVIDFIGQDGSRIHFASK